MKKKYMCFVIIFSLLSFNLLSQEPFSLSEIFSLGKILQDKDNDTWADKTSLQIIIPDNPTAYEITVASDIAARANLESLVVDFSLVKKESEALKGSRENTNILIGSNLKLLKNLSKEGNFRLPHLSSTQGIVSLYSTKGQRYIAVASGSQEVLLRTGRAFFLRWPYLWDILGRDEGTTYSKVEKDLAQFLENNNIQDFHISIQSALYDFPSFESPHESIKRLKFNNGEIKQLAIHVDFPSKEEKGKALKVLERLSLLHSKGEQTNVLSYTGCAKIQINLRCQQETSQISLTRLSHPKRILTPSYKSIRKPKISGKDFDLISFFSGNGVYSDENKDGILDHLDSIIVIPQDFISKEISSLVSRFVLSCAGASFPILYLDKEIEDAKTLVAPILIGNNNALIKDLCKIGKIKIPELPKGFAMAKVILQAFNKSNALAIIGADRTGLEKVLSYIGQIFPYFTDYKEGHPNLNDVSLDLESFIKGEKGSAEAFFEEKIKKWSQGIKHKELEYVTCNLYLPQNNPTFESCIQEYLDDTLQSQEIHVKSFSLDESKTIFNNEKDFLWEGNEALRQIEEKIDSLKDTNQPVRISVGLSESPQVRAKLKERIESFLTLNNIHQFHVEVLSSYKQGFFWLTEKVVPALKGKNINRLKIRFAKAQDDFSKPKRFYTEPLRWLQELYPVDEIISQKTGLPLDKIEFQMKEEQSPAYELIAYDDKDIAVLHENFSPRTREHLYLNILPEWGTVQLTTGWIKIEMDGQIIFDVSLKSDLENFWNYYQEEVLPQVYSYILKNTGDDPTFSKQPYFKRLLVELWLSEPDYKLGLDEELISSLESIHDEIYFDTLDFLRGITKVELEEDEHLEDTSRYSAPGNILPLVHQSLEGERGHVKVTFEDWQARSPQIFLKWKERGRKEFHKKVVFPLISFQNLRAFSFIYNGQEEKIETIHFSLEINKEAEYREFLNIIHLYKNLLSQGILTNSFCFPNIKSLSLNIKSKDLQKEVLIPVSDTPFKETAFKRKAKEKTEAIVPTDEIISPEVCLNIVNELSQFQSIHSYIAGESFEKRKIPVIEAFTPIEKYVSIPRLITFKPTAYFTARQHANEVSSTNYILRFAELLAKDKNYQEYLKKVNFVLHPMENPDGAQVAYTLQKMTPYHSLHAGRYSSLGMDIGYQVDAKKPILPEAKVRKNLYNKWFPDIYLNLHGYPSHEWVQQFSNYSPYLFRDYWIPRGGFIYYKSLSLPIYEKWHAAGEQLKAMIIHELTTDRNIRESNKKFYDRYFRWAARWQPHLNFLEIYDGVNLYKKRRSSRESKLSPRQQITFVEETPELMDETARGKWLDFLCEQGLAYLRAHMKYLGQTCFERVRIEEEYNDRIHIQFIRSRPGKTEPLVKEHQ